METATKVLVALVEHHEDRILLRNLIRDLRKILAGNEVNIRTSLDEVALVVDDLEARNLPRQLSPIQQTVLDALADRQFTHEHWVSRRRISAMVDIAGDGPEFERALSALAPTLARRTRGDRGDVYTLTVEGLAQSSWRVRAADVVVGLLGALRTLLNANPDAHFFTWGQLKAHCNWSDSEFQFVTEVITICELGGGGGGVQQADDYQWRVPQNADSLVALQNFSQLLAHMRDCTASDRDRKTATEGLSSAREGVDQGRIDPKPPEILQKIAWFLKHGPRHWKLLSIAIVILAVPLAWSTLFAAQNESADDYYQEGMAAYEMLDYQRGQQAFREALRLRPNFPEALAQLNLTREDYLKKQADLFVRAEEPAPRALIHVYSTLSMLEGPEAAEVLGGLDALTSVLPDRYPFSLYEFASPGVLVRHDVVTAGNAVDGSGFQSVLGFLGSAQTTIDTLTLHLTEVNVGASERSRLETEVEAARRAVDDIIEALADAPALQRATRFVLGK